MSPSTAPYDSPQALADDLHSLLSEGHYDPDWMAVPALQFRSAHPDLLRLYAPVLSQTAAPMTLRAQLRRELSGFRDRIGQFGPLDWGDVCPAQLDLLFVSHFIRDAQASAPTPDPYFGALPEIMNSRGLRSATALIDQRPQQTDIRTMWRPGQNTPRLVLAPRLGPISESRIASRAARAARGLAGAQTGPPALRRFAAQQARSGATRQGLRIAAHIARLVQATRPKAIVFTYEGHAWERLIMRAARQVHPDVKCYGFHHAILAPVQRALLHRYGPDYDPDHLFVAGDVAADWFRASGAFPDRPVEILGSPRAQAAQAKDKTAGTNCLFLPEGILQESLILAQAAFDLAQARPDLTCTVRLHPVLPYATLAAARPSLAAPLPNLNWSAADQPLTQDCAKARWCVYRGSSAVLTALSYGAEPIYLGQEPEALRIDPLQGRTGFGHVAPTSQDLQTLLHPGAYSPQALAAGQRYCARYYRPLDPDILYRAIANSP